jgi:hypothetical protein
LGILFGADFEQRGFTHLSRAGDHQDGKTIADGVNGF